MLTNTNPRPVYKYTVYANVYTNQLCTPIIINKKFVWPYYTCVAQYLFFFHRIYIYGYKYLTDCERILLTTFFFCQRKANTLLARDG